MVSNTKCEGKALVSEMKKTDGGGPLPTMTRYMEGAEMVLDAKTSKGVFRRFFVKI